jgi:hypothetical protein
MGFDHLKSFVTMVLHRMNCEEYSRGSWQDLTSCIWFGYTVRLEYVICEHPKVVQRVWLQGGYPTLRRDH